MLGNFTVLFGGNVIGQLAYFVGLLYVARALGPAEFGTWNFSQVLMLYLLRVGDPGLEVRAIREVAHNLETTRQRITSVILTRGAIALVLLILEGVAVTLGLLPIESVGLTMIFSIALLPTAATLEWVYEARQEVRYVSLARIMKGVLFAAFVIVALNSGPPSRMAAIGYVVSIAIPVVILSTVAIRHFGWGSVGAAWGEAPRLLAEGWPIGLISLLAQYCFFLGTLLGGYLWPANDLGLYTAGHRPVIFLWAYVIVSSNRVLLPSLTRFYHASGEQFIGFIERFFRLAALAAIPLSFIGIVVAPVMLPLLFGAQYASGVGVFQILLVALVIAMVRSIFEIALLAAEKQRDYLMGMGFLAVVYTLATPALMLTVGIEGAAWASVVAEASFLVYLMATFRGVRFPELLTQVVKPAVAIIPGGAVAALAVGVPMPVVVIVGLMAYVGILLLWKGIGQEDILLVRSLIASKSLGMS